MYTKLTCLLALTVLTACTPVSTPTIMQPITYVPIGDSYTEGTGVQPSDAWPVLLTEQLQAEGIDITLIKNIAKSGWTSGDAVKGQLPEFTNLEPNFATLFIGANDVFQGVPVEQFSANYTVLVETMLQVVPAGNLVLITIPDYTYTPLGIAYGRGASITNNLKEFNEVIYTAAKTYNLDVADVHSVSKKFMFDVSLVAEDGLHPSRKGHELWNSIIYPVVRAKIQDLLIQQ